VAILFHINNHDNNNYDSSQHKLGSTIFTNYSLLSHIFVISEAHMYGSHLIMHRTIGLTGSIGCL